MVLGVQYLGVVLNLEFFSGGGLSDLSGYPSSRSKDVKPLLDLSALRGALGNLDVRNDCDIDTGEGCDVHEVCNLVVEETVMGSVCQCDDGYVIDTHTQKCTGKLALASFVGLVPFLPRSSNWFSSFQSLGGFFWC